MWLAPIMCMVVPSPMKLPFPMTKFPCSWYLVQSKVKRFAFPRSHVRSTLGSASKSESKISMSCQAKTNLHSNHSPPIIGTYLGYPNSRLARHEKIRRGTVGPASPALSPGIPAGFSMTSSASLSAFGISVIASVAYSITFSTTSAGTSPSVSTLTATGSPGCSRSYTICNKSSRMQEGPWRRIA